MTTGRRDIIPPAGAPPRLCTRAFPPYRHVPGLHPHPTAHPEGHSHEGAGGAAHALTPPDLEHWAHNDEYLYGIDLYNHGYWWEAHEAWEGLWQLTDKQGLIGRYLQGMIQVSAAHLQRHVGHEEGVARLVTRSHAHLESALQMLGTDTVIMGVDVRAFLDDTQRYFRKESSYFPFIRIRSERESPHDG